VLHIVHALRVALESVLSLLDRLPAWLSLAVVAIATALLMIVAIKLVSPQRLIARARDQMAAAIYEMRLFLDNPGRLVRAQGRLLAWLVVYLLALLPSMLALAPPLGLLYLHLEVRHGLAPIAVPATVVMRIELADGVDGDMVQVSPDPGASLTAPLVYAADEATVYARLRIETPGAHEVAVAAGGDMAMKRIVAGEAAAVVAPERRGGLGYLWALGDEAPTSGAIRAIRVASPDRQARYLHLRIPWWLYWLGLSTIAALLVRRRFGVEL
jgi:hypothetical protein